MAEAGDPNVRQLEPAGRVAATGGGAATGGVKFSESGGQRTRSRTIGWRRHAQGSGRQSGHADGVARHVEELDGAAFFGNTRHDVPLHDCADVAGPQTVLGNARVRITSPYMSKGMSYLGYMVMNRGTFSSSVNLPDRAEPHGLSAGRLDRTLDLVNDPVRVLGRPCHVE